ncbi:MAG: LysM peptidoglycan-binding domain-containing protein, partial [Kiritimatiellae bacterium]|nr:LysM peptidoglycan-binding domain-containing protein [Kiritimatiellia bacterium]
MNMKRTIVVGTITALLLGLAGTGTALVRMHGKVRALEQERAQLAQQIGNRAEPAPAAPRKKDAAKASAPAKDTRPYYEYVVKEGDDLVSIAVKFEVSPSAVMEMNDLKPLDEISPGIKLKIPGKRAEELAKANAVAAAALTNDLTSAIRVVRTAYDGETTLRVHLSRRPDMDVIRHYVSVAPLQEGGLSFAYDAEWNSNRKIYEPVVVITGDYAHRTNVTLHVKKGLPPFGKGANPEAEGVLRDGYAYTFRRKDRDPYVTFADGGRYLPPGGLRALKVESVNVGKVRASVRRVEPRSIVQLLAREEGTYSRYEWKRDVDDEETAELAGEAEETTIACPNRLNEKEHFALPVKMNDGKATNGVFLVSLFNGDKPREDYRWNNDYNPLRFRLVCLSDLGLSVRSSGEDGLGVWVTSLLKGTPAAGAQVEVYSTANTKVMEGVTDGRGWCRPARVDKGKPFAVVVRSASGDDMTFLALRDSMQVDESYADGARENYLDDKQATAFCWTDRGIYRHGEKIFVHVIARTGARRAPLSMPVALRLVNPNGHTYASVTKTTDSEGAVSHDGFAVADDQPSGGWTIVAEVPGKNGRRLGETDVKIEEFAPPQIRVAVETASAPHPTNFAFTVKAEHLFGGPAQGLACEGAVVFEDAPFAPADWKGWRFGNENLGLKPNFRELPRSCLAADGSFRFDAPIWADTGLPKAAVRATAQGVVFEDGGRPATARKSAVRHYYPFYIGTTATSSMKLERGVRPRVAVACVAPDGRRLAETRTLTAEIERVDTVYSYRTKPDGWQAWDCDRVNVLVASNIVLTTSTNENTILELPLEQSGDYVLTIKDSASRASFGLNFYLSDCNDNVVRAPLSNPTEVTLVPDKRHYRAGETPRLTVKAPFAGYALVSVMREKEVYTEVHNLTNATSEVVLRPVTADQAPNLDVYVSVVQSVAANARHLAVRAHGQATVSIRPEENEVPVAVDAKVVGFREVDVEIAAPRATVTVVTVVDEAINLLCGGETPDPVGYFSQARCAEHPLHDLYHRILPVVGEGELRVNGVKTGGGFGAEMLGRVSPVPTRRFKPLALWSGRVPVVDGKARTTFKLPEFVGEVRVTAVAYSASAAGAASVQRKVAPKLVTMPDAPRFVAPGDRFEATLPIHNRSGAAAEFACTISTNGVKAFDGAKLALAKDASTNVVVQLVAPAEPGELTIAYRVAGMGEE